MLDAEEARERVRRALELLRVEQLDEYSDHLMNPPLRSQLAARLTRPGLHEGEAVFHAYLARTLSHLTAQHVASSLGVDPREALRDNLRAVAALFSENHPDRRAETEEEGIIHGRVGFMADYYLNRWWPRKPTEVPWGELQRAQEELDRLGIGGTRG